MDACGAPLDKLGVRHSQNDGVVGAGHRSTGERADVAFVLGFRQLDPRVVDINLGVVAFEFADDENDPGVARVGAAFLEDVVDR